jgi:hypothetical protein
MKKIGKKVEINLIEKKSTLLVKKGAFLKVQSQKDRKNPKIRNLVAFHKGFRLPIDKSHENFAKVREGEYWYLEYYSNEQKNAAFAKPVFRPKMTAEVVIKDGFPGMSVEVKIPKTQEVVSGTRRSRVLLKQRFPDSREMTTFMEQVLRKKCKERSLTAYADQIVQYFIELMAEVSAAEQDCMDAIKETVEALKELPTDPVAGPYNTYTIDEIRQYAACIFDAHSSLEDNPLKIMDPKSAAELLASQEQLNICKYDAQKRVFLSPKIGKLV